jgi:hypothetical protein
VAAGRRHSVLGAFLGGVYLAAGQPERYAEVARIHLAGGREADTVARATYVMALAALGSSDEAVAAASGLIDAAEIVRNPSVLSLALLAFGYAFWEADPVRALDAVRRGLAIAQDDGDRMSESHLAMSLSRLEAEHGDRLVALDYCTLAVRNYHDAGNTSQLRIVLAILAAFLHRLGHNRSAAVIAGFAVSAFTTATPAAMVAYAYDQIGEARAELEQLR